LGVGGTLTEGTLHVLTGSAGAVTASGVADEGVFENSGSAGIHILSPDVNPTSVYMGSPSQSVGAFIDWLYGAAGATQILQLGTNSAVGQVSIISGVAVEAIHIDENQLVSIGNPIPAALLDITKTLTDGTRIIDVSAVAQPSATYWAVDIGPQIEPQAAIGTILGSLNTLDIDNSAFDITTTSIACQYQVRLKAGYSGTVNRAVALNAQPPQVLAGTLTEAVGVNIGALTTATSKGIVSRVASAANKWNLYCQGTADNYLQGNTGIGIIVALGKAHVDQSSTTAAIPVAYFDQADVSEEMFEFATTIGVGNAIEAVGAKTLTTTHFIKVTLPGGLTRYFPVGTIA